MPDLRVLLQVLVLPAHLAYGVALQQGLQFFILILQRSDDILIVLLLLLYVFLLFVQLCFQVGDRVAQISNYIHTLNYDEQQL